MICVAAPGIPDVVGGVWGITQKFFNTLTSGGLHSSNSKQRNIALVGLVLRSAIPGGKYFTSANARRAWTWTKRGGGAAFFGYNVWDHHRNGDGWTEALLKGATESAMAYAGAELGSTGGALLGGSLGPEGAVVGAGVGGVAGGVGGGLAGRWLTDRLEESVYEPAAAGINQGIQLPARIFNRLSPVDIPLDW